MAKLEDLTRGASVKGIIPDGLVTIESIKWIGSAAVELIYKDIRTLREVRRLIRKPYIHSW